jgi:DNA-binding transcriptional ArsR family regulator
VGQNRRQHDSHIDSRRRHPVTPALRDERVVRQLPAFRALTTPVRLAMVNALVDKGELTAGDLGRLTGLPPTQSSQNLRILRDAGLVKQTRCGRTMRYRLVPNAVRFIEAATQLTEGGSRG